jgi:hypothetical protein
MNFQKRRKYKNATNERFARPYVWMVIHANTSHRLVWNFAKDI